MMTEIVIVVALLLAAAGVFLAFDRIRAEYRWARGVRRENVRAACVPSDGPRLLTAAEARVAALETRLDGERAQLAALMSAEPIDPPAVRRQEAVCAITQAELRLWKGDLVGH